MIRELSTHDAISWHESDQLCASEGSRELGGAVG